MKTKDIEQPQAANLPLEAGASSRAEAVAFAAGQRAAGSAWHVVHTVPRAEWQAHRRLRERGFATWFPHYPATVRTGRRMIGVFKPLFARYLFVRIATGQSIYTVLHTPGVASLVNVGGRPLEVPPPVMAELLALGDENGRVAPKERASSGPDWKVGEWVFVAEGAFAGFLAEVATVDGGEAVRVWIEMFGRAVAATVPSGALSREEPRRRRRGSSHRGR